MARTNQAAPSTGRGKAAPSAEIQTKAIPPVPAKEPLYTWERVSGKHHLRTPSGIVVIKVGDRVSASRDAYSRDSSWKLVGPVVSAGIAAPPKFELRKEAAAEEGFFNVFKSGEDSPLNSTPLTEQEADELVNASLEPA